MTTTPQYAITHEEDARGGEFLLTVEGREAGELSYARRDDALVVFNHTGVRPEYEGHGWARRLFDAAVTWARDTDTKVISTCSYASAQFRRDKASQDVLADTSNK
jgi:predicted GNAT family acetyltransferase